MDRNAEVQKMASQFGLDANALHHLVAFLCANHVRHTEGGKIPDAMSAAEQEEYIRAGVVAWRDHTSALLRSCATARAIAPRPSAQSSSSGSMTPFAATSEFHRADYELR